jgi:hypothetical protein
MDHIAAKEHAEVLDKQLRADDPELSTVQVVTVEGSSFLIHDALLFESDEWVWVPTEHYGCLLFEKEMVIFHAKLAVNEIDYYTASPSKSPP